MLVPGFFTFPFPFRLPPVPGCFASVASLSQWQFDLTFTMGTLGGTGDGKGLTMTTSCGVMSESRLASVLSRDSVPNDVEL